MSTEIKAVKLYKNHIYPTYQLFARMAHEKTAPADGLRYGALLSMNWVKNRLENDCPEELKNVPDPSSWKDVTDDVLFSYHINEGFVIDIVSAPQLGEWSLQITEPDLGTRTPAGKLKRAAVPGRIIESDIAFKVNGNTLDCAFKTVISDPENETEPAEVYRFALVKRLAEDPEFGLKQIVELDGTKRMLSSKDQVKNFLELKDNAACQLPIFVFTEEKEPVRAAVPAAVKKEKRKEPAVFAPMPGKKEFPLSGKTFSVDAPPVGSPFFGSAMGKLELELGATPKAEVSAKKCLLDIDRFAGATLGVALVFFLESGQMDRFQSGTGICVKPGDVIFLDPVSFGGHAQVLDLSDKKDAKSQAVCLTGLAYHWFLGKKFTFGNVSFVSAARQNVFAAIGEAEKAAGTIEEKFRKDLDVLKVNTRADLKRMEDENADLNAQLERQKEYVTQLSGEKTALREQHAKELAKKDAVISKKEQMIGFLKRKCTRPQDMSDVADWIRENFSDRLILHDRAVNLLSDKSARDTDTSLVLDALEYLAEEFYDMQFSGISEEEVNRRCSEKYGRPFEFTPVSDVTYNNSGLYHQYHVPYKKDGWGKPVDRPLDMHVKCGNTAPYLVRIYFFLDKEDKKIVVGSLPGHLGTLTFG